MIKIDKVKNGFLIVTQDTFNIAEYPLSGNIYVASSVDDLIQTIRMIVLDQEKLKGE